MRTTSRKSACIVVLGVLVATLAGTAPSHAQIPGVLVNNLTPFGVNALGSIRVKPVATIGSGLQLLQGDGTQKQNPNRTLGDTSVDCPDPTCRLLGFNGAFQTGWDFHTHYHAGDTRILINNSAGFIKGDTILIGSPNCNYPFKGLTCGDEPAQGEIAHIVNLAFNGVADLAFPLSLDHDQGVRVTKYSTAYPGQNLRVEIPDRALNNNNTMSTSARAWLLPPGSDPADEDAYYALPPVAFVCPTTDCSHIVPNTATGTTNFFIHEILTGLFNVGRTFQSGSGDDWYSVLVVADNINPPFNRIADGFWRFKLNPYSFGQIDCDGNNVPESSVCIRPDKQLPGFSVSIAGRLVDNSSVAARDRNVESVIIDTTVTKPSTDQFTRSDRTCWDSNAGPSDTCGRRPIFGGPATTHHGEFFVTVGALQCLNLGGAPPGTCSGTPVEWVLNDLGHIAETLELGTYFVEARPRIVLPVITLDAQFDITLAPFL